MLAGDARRPGARTGLADLGFPYGSTPPQPTSGRVAFDALGAPDGQA